jgi:phosphohistidine phosphatase
MAQQLWFLRHGEAEPRGTRPDSERRLTPKGEAQARAAGVALARLRVDFAVVLTSPRRRALDTARLACLALGQEPVVHEPLSSGFDVHEALSLAGPGERRVLLVGHEPDFSQVVHDLTGARIALRKGGVAAVRLHNGLSDLLVLLRPRELEVLAGVPEPEREPAGAVKP